MHRLIEQIQSLATAPEQDDAYRAWLTQEDALAFLRENVRSDEIIIYAGVPYSFMHGVLVPKKVLETHDIEDLLGWSYNPFSSWSTVSSGTDAWIEPPLSDCGSKLLATGEQIVFARNFHGVAEREYYFEISHPLTHTADIHFMRERNAWCRLDRHGDIEDVIRIIELPSPQQGTVVLARRDVLATYATLTGSSFARMFDFTRFRPGKFPGWGDHKEVLHSDGELHSGLEYFRGRQAMYAEFSSFASAGQRRR